jgi:hypothetical protein
MSPVTSCLLVLHIFLSNLLLDTLKSLCSSLILLQPYKWASGNTVFFILHVFTSNRKSMFLPQHFIRIYQLYLGDRFLLLSEDDKINIYLLFSAYTCTQTSYYSFEQPNNRNISVSIHHNADVLLGQTERQIQIELEMIIDGRHYGIFIKCIS